MSEFDHNKLTGSELIALKRAAQMLSIFNDYLVEENLGDPIVVRNILAKATPELIREAFDGSN